MDFDLDRLGPRQFEHLVQALAILEFGPNVKVFGDGPDGGREATFRGRVKSPHGGDGFWDGYGVIQAKHRLHPENVASNAAWLKSQISSELKPLLRARTEGVRGTPEYYVMASNVRLSAVERTGGVDAVEDYLRHWSQEVGFTDIAVWHYDHICRLLEIHDGVRRSYAGFITTGDLISDLTKFADRETEKIASRIRTHAATQLRNTGWVRLSDLGRKDDGKLPLSSIGIELPVKEMADLHHDRRGVLQRIIDAGEQPLRRSLRSDKSPAVVVVGGPGQGKSTIGRIVSQGYRAALLGDADRFPTVRAEVSRTRESLARMGLSTPAHRRWPVTVELSKYGDALAANPELSLLAFIARELSASGKPVKTHELSRWLGEWPWILILDGLDEVAALESRSRVVDGIGDFVIDIDEADGDVLLVATTRPQGYHNEFHSLDPQMLTLRDLTGEEGAELGRLIAAARHPDDHEKRREVSDRLRKAVQSTSPIARLMQTPLQVAIITTLLERPTRAPSNRYHLFDSYYDAIYTREMSKAGRLGELLETYRSDVNFVHEQVALELHTGAEKNGRAESVLPTRRLNELLEARLKAAEHSAEAIASLSAELLRAARERLVLLVAVSNDSIGFEVRSLQEYMAARAITSGPETLVLDRLSALMTSIHWRNTWLLAAGRIQHRMEHLTDSLLAGLRVVDADTLEGQFVAPGERLALDLLEDDFALTVPGVRRSLLTHSLEALRRWPGTETPRLAVVIGNELNSNDRETEALTRRAFQDALASTGRSHVTAMITLRLMKTARGQAGVLAHGLLDRENEQEYVTVRTNAPPQTKSVARAIKSHLRLEKLVEADRLLAKQLVQLMAHQYLATSLARAELLTLEPIAGDVAVRYDEALESPLFATELMEAADKLQPSDAVFAIFVRQVVTILWERRLVGPRLLQLNELQRARPLGDAL